MAFHYFESGLCSSIKNIIMKHDPSKMPHYFILQGHLRILYLVNQYTILKNKIMSMRLVNIVYLLSKQSVICRSLKVSNEGHCQSFLRKQISCASKRKKEESGSRSNDVIHFYHKLVIPSKLYYSFCTTLSTLNSLPLCKFIFFSRLNIRREV